MKDKYEIEEIFSRHGVADSCGEDEEEDDEKEACQVIPEMSS